MIGFSNCPNPSSKPAPRGLFVRTQANLIYRVLYRADLCKSSKRKALPDFLTSARLVTISGTLTLFLWGLSCVYQDCPSRQAEALVILDHLVSRNTQCLN